MAKLSAASIEAFKDFIDLVDLRRTKQGLRKLLLYYLIHESEELPQGFEDFIEDVDFLLDFIEKVEEEI